VVCVSSTASSFLHSPRSPYEVGYMLRPTNPQTSPMDGCYLCPKAHSGLGGLAGCDVLKRLQPMFPSPNRYFDSIVEQLHLGFFC